MAPNISDEAYKRALERLQTERNHIAERKDEVTREIRKLNESSVSMMGLKQLRANLGERINSTEFEDRRYVLETLSTRVTVTTDAKLLVDFAIPKEISAQAIALSVPLNACPQYSVFGNFQGLHRMTRVNYCSSF